MTLHLSRSDQDFMATNRGRAPLTDVLLALPAGHVFEFARLKLLSTN